MKTVKVPASSLRSGNMLVIEGETREVVDTWEGKLTDSAAPCVVVQLAHTKRVFSFEPEAEVAVEVTDHEF